MWWLHSETNYTYNGDAPVDGLTQPEVDLLMLGNLVTAESRQAAASNTPSQVARRKQELQQGHHATRKDVFGDLGIQ